MPARCMSRVRRLAAVLAGAVVVFASLFSPGSVAADDELVWTDDVLEPFVAGVAYSDAVHADGANLYEVFDGSLPAGISLNPMTGALTGTPSAGTYMFMLRASNGPLTAPVIGFAGDVVPAPVWTDTTLAPFVAGVAYVDYVAATGTPAPTFILAAGALPDGISLDSDTGKVYGTPTTVGSYSFTLEASNGVGESPSKKFTGKVQGIVWTDTFLAPAQVGVAYSDQIAVESAPPSVTYRVFYGDVPPGLVLDPSTGSVTGTPTVAGEYAFGVEADNGVTDPVITELFVEVSPSGGGGPGGPGDPDGPDGSGLGGFVPVDPSRVLDTRLPADGAAPVPAGGVRAVRFAGVAGVPADATAVTVNVTVTEPSAAGFITAFPCDQERPLASNVNYSAGRTSANAVSVALSVDGEACFFSLAAAHVIVDVAGAQSNAGYPADLMALAPVRLADTREPDAATGGARLRAGVPLVLDVTHPDVPGRVDAAVLNLTAVDPVAPGFLTAYPCGGERPFVSNVNFLAGEVIANAATVKAAQFETDVLWTFDYQVCVVSSVDAHVVVDLTGIYTPQVAGGRLVAGAPQRLADTREAGGRVAGGSQIALDVAELAGLPDDARAVTLNVTVVEPDAPGYVTVFPCAAGRPHTSNGNYLAGQVVANAATVPVADGGVCVYTHAGAHIVVDLTAVYVAAG